MLEVIVYKRPRGVKATVSITNVYPEDAQFFNDNDICVGMEDCGGFFALCGDLGIEVGGEPLEAIYATPDYTSVSSHEASTSFARNVKVC